MRYKPGGRAALGETAAAQAVAERATSPENQPETKHRRNESSFRRIYIVVMR